MKSNIIAVVVASIGLGMSASAQADQAISTAELLNYCKGQDGAFVTCEIYGQAVYDTYMALSADKLAPNMICVKQPAPTRTEVIQEYVKWADGNTKTADQPAAQTILQFLSQRFPCS